MIVGFKSRVDVKDLIESMREELAVERGEKYIKPADRPKGKPIVPVRPNPKHKKKPKKSNIFAKKYSKKKKAKK